MQEDHVSMGWSAARKLRRSVDNVRRILAVELVAAAGASTCARRCSPRRDRRGAARAARDVPGPGVDRFLAPELGAAEVFLRDGGVELALAGAGVTLP